VEGKDRERERGGRNEFKQTYHPIPSTDLGIFFK
jgi:hypothetical protein